MICEPEKVRRLAAERNEYPAATGQLWPVRLELGIPIRLVPADPTLLPAFKPWFHHLVLLFPLAQKRQSVRQTVVQPGDFSGGNETENDQDDEPDDIVVRAVQ